MASRPQFDPVTEADLQCFVDGRLSPERHMEINAFLARTPDARRRVDSYRDLNRSLHGLYSNYSLPEADETITQLEEQLAGRLVTRQKFRWVMSAAAALVLSVGIGTTASYLTRQVTKEPDHFAQFTGMAGKAHQLYASSEGGAVQINSITDRGAVLFRAMSHYLSGLPSQAPDLSGHGFMLIGGQMTPGTKRPSLHFVYSNDKNQLISLHAGFADYLNAMEPTFTNIGATPAFYWRRGGVAFTLVGHLPQIELLAMAQTISRLEEPTKIPEQPQIKQATAPALETTAAVPVIEKTILEPVLEIAPTPDTSPSVPEIEAVIQAEPKDT